MLRYLALVCLFGLFACGSARKTPYHWGLSMADSTFLDKQPIPLTGYNEFLTYFLFFRGDTAAFKDNFPDTMLIHKKYPGMTNSYRILRNPILIDSAIVGVTYSSALAYNKWRTEIVRVTDPKSRRILYNLPGPEDFKKAERLAAGRNDKANWKHLFEGPPEWTNIPGYVWVKSNEGGRLVQASEVPAHEITFRCKAELRPPILPPIF